LVVAAVLRGRTQFVAGPEVWKIVEGKLYVSLDKGIQ